MKKYVIIPAAGSGTRLGTEVPKQFLKVNNKYILNYSLETFNNHSGIDKILVVTSKDYIELVKDIVAKNTYNKVVDIIEGGKERQDSVFNALKHLKQEASDDDIVLIHDAARPLISNELISNVIQNTLVNSASIVAIKAKDTVINVKEKVINGFLDRNIIYLAQTPQAFKFGIIIDCFIKSYAENMYFTDESTMLNYFGYDVYITDGSLFNFKITTKEDLELFQNIMVR
ncbi:MAG TPA: 2-C-methyl-D-erythritol 4-phosphate cytidylyltransferase [Ignavibacteriales bacterium]|nr:2-C-methyl-D-erythritol 4-phosphate cytidylyltransferase [Ignavibacteriales bacterium]